MKVTEVSREEIKLRQLFFYQVRTLINRLTLKPMGEVAFLRALKKTVMSQVLFQPCHNYPFAPTLQTVLRSGVAGEFSRSSIRILDALAQSLGGCFCPTASLAGIDGVDKKTPTRLPYFITGIRFNLLNDSSVAEIREFIAQSQNERLLSFNETLGLLFFCPQLLTEGYTVVAGGSELKNNNFCPCLSWQPPNLVLGRIRQGDKINMAYFPSLEGRIELSFYNAIRTVVQRRPWRKLPENYFGKPE